ncbi:hypothetical protein FEF34_26700 [Streptomyces marianii]|uniref:Uncharacterized protein n=1 Tax=Streptomyces marianii TaxID=1817406 RepID=A0A5R9E7U7_9ACTN|nr:hypothetical protein FEF34_26700 [Streptomyces marianii]
MADVARLVLEGREEVFESAQDDDRRFLLFVCDERGRLVVAVAFGKAHGDVGLVGGAFSRAGAGGEGGRGVAGDPELDGCSAEDGAEADGSSVAVDQVGRAVGGRFGVESPVSSESLGNGGRRFSDCGVGDEHGACLQEVC